jgi:hypothetical protein
LLRVVKLVNCSGVIRNIMLSGQARGRISDSGATKKLAGFFIRNLVKLLNLDPAAGEKSYGIFVAAFRPYLSNGSRIDSATRNQRQVSKICQPVTKAKKTRKKNLVASAVTVKDIDSSRKKKRNRGRTKKDDDAHNVNDVAVHAQTVVPTGVEDMTGPHTDVVPHVPDYSGPAAATAAEHRQLFGRGGGELGDDKFKQLVSFTVFSFLGRKNVQELDTQTLCDLLFYL